jgi:tetratricopeptide (TPR) repeat protein
MGLGKCFLARKDYKNAALIEKRAIQLFPNNHWAYLALGDAYNGLGQKGDSLEAYRKAIQISPKDPACRAVLTNLLKQKTASLPSAFTTR